MATKFFELIDNDIKEAIKNKENEKLIALRAIKAELLLLKTSGKPDVTDEDVIKALQKMIKQRQQSAEIYLQNGRQDLYEQEMKEISFIKPYLPEELSDQQLEETLKQIIEQVGAKDAKDFGKVMGIATKQLQGKADNKKIAEFVRKLLGN